MSTFSGITEREKMQIAVAIGERIGIKPPVISDPFADLAAEVIASAYNDYVIYAVRAHTYKARFYKGGKWNTTAHRCWYTDAKSKALYADRFLRDNNTLYMFYAALAQIEEPETFREAVYEKAKEEVERKIRQWNRCYQHTK